MLYVIYFALLLALPIIGCVINDFDDGPNWKPCPKLKIIFKNEEKLNERKRID